MSYDPYADEENAPQFMDNDIEDRNDDSAKFESILDDDLPDYEASLDDEDFSGASSDNNGNEYPNTDR